jgi:hypothetical protein
MDIVKIASLASQILEETGVLGGGSEPVPDGMVAVYPTGVLYRGGPRLYPTPQPGEFPLSYVDRMSKTSNPKTGKPYFPNDRLGVVIQSWGYFPGGTALADGLDRLLFEADWYTQAEVDRLNNLNAIGHVFSPGR